MTFEAKSYEDGGPSGVLPGAPYSATMKWTERDAFLHDLPKPKPHESGLLNRRRPHERDTA